MAQVKRPSGRPRTIGGGKLALFEVIQAAQTGDGAGQDSDAVAPLVSGAAATRESARDAAVPQALTLRSAGEPRRHAAKRSSFGLALAAASLIAVVGVALAAGHMMGNRGATQAASAEGAPVPEVLDVGKRTSRGAGTGNGQALASRTSETQTTVAQVGPAIVPHGFRRTNGLNYLLVQSYHPSEEDRALATIEALRAAGLAATIERDITGWGSRLCVVGTEGFERMGRNPAFDDYRRRIMAVSEQTRGNRKIKTFEPQPVQWSRG